MRLKTRTWIVISLLCFAGAWYFWRLGEERAARDPRNQRDTSAPASTASRTNLTKAGAQGNARPAPLLIERAAQTNAAAAAVAAAAPNTNYPHRLSNTTKSIGELTRSDSAIL